MNRKQARACGPDLLLLVELPGIEPSALSEMNCGNADLDDVKGHQTTCGYAADVDGINTSEINLV